MTALRKRAHAQETRFVREEELAFRAEARRNALIGLWAAAMIDRPDADAYARGIVEAGVENPNGILDRLQTDFEAAGVIFLEDDIRERMTGMLRSLRDEMYAA
ncbi:DUF1476 domain-containing protein [Rhizobium sp. DKSPLA3]|uniref:DUF1476 domain-containing protein n=1 Tax=Rhizobium quercicola TaxID=2901226 RepID=A0A9X1NWS0_9HYPH|nr:ATPase inhibitor subunit zeta [Rhizobium quercicola]MCD7111124.1 DUF1476 domain-containing protein [Rhizobium quercicola]